jgi:hypothetical protein
MKSCSFCFLVAAESFTHFTISLWESLSISTDGSAADSIESSSFLSDMLLLADFLQQILVSYVKRRFVSYWPRRFFEFRLMGIVDFRANRTDLVALCQSKLNKARLDEKMDVTCSAGIPCCIGMFSYKILFILTLYCKHYSVAQNENHFLKIADSSASLVHAHPTFSNTSIVAAVLAFSDC